MPSQHLVGHALPDDGCCCVREPLGVRQFAIVETEALFVQIAEQMERLDGYVGATDGSLQQRPEVFAAVRMNLPVNVRLGMVNNLMRVFVAQASVGLERIGVD